MASTTDLGKILLTNGGEYDPEAVYEQLTMVMYENSTYVTLKTVQGITPTDDHENYQLMAKGFDATALKEVEAEDTSGVLGEAGSTVSAQDLVDWVVDQAANKLLKLTDLVSVQTNDPTKGVSAALAYTMGQKIDEVNSNITAFTTKLESIIKVHDLGSGIEYNLDNYSGNNEKCVHIFSGTDTGINSGTPLPSKAISQVISIGSVQIACAIDNTYFIRYYWGVW